MTTIKIITFTDKITECECCGRTELKGTFCLTIDGEEHYYGSTCAGKAHGVTEDEKHFAKDAYKHSKKMYQKHIQPLIDACEFLMANSGSVERETIKQSYQRHINEAAKKYRIAL